MDFKIIFYRDKKGRNPIEEFLVGLSKSNKALVAKTHQGIEKLRYRTFQREPLSKYLEPHLWELRIKSGNDILRIIYTFEKDQIIVLLHIFVKKQQKTLQTDLEMARQRLKELKGIR